MILACSNVLKVLLAVNPMTVCVCLVGDLLSRSQTTASLVRLKILPYLYLLTLWLVCGDKIVVGSEQCDGGVGCCGCNCRNGFVPTNPPSKGTCHRVILKLCSDTRVNTFDAKIVFLLARQSLLLLLLLPPFNLPRAASTAPLLRRAGKVIAMVPTLRVIATITLARASTSDS